MTVSHPYALSGVLAFFMLLAAVLLVDVLAAVSLAITIVYLLVPLRRRPEACGASRRVVGLAATVVAVVGVGVVFVSSVAIFFLCLSNILKLTALLPDVVIIELLEMVETVTLDDTVAVGLGLPRSVGHAAVTAVSVILIKLMLFGLLVLALFLSGDTVGRTLPALAPADYQGAATALNERARETLFTIYILQAATAVGTLAIGLAVFWALGYDYVATLATVAAVLQFIPIADLSVLLTTMVTCRVAVSNVVAAALVVALLVESVDLLGTELRVDDVGGDGGERDESVGDSVDPSQP